MVGRIANHYFAAIFTGRDCTKVRLGVENQSLFGTLKKLGAWPTFLISGGGVQNTTERLALQDAEEKTYRA